MKILMPLLGLTLGLAGGGTAAYVFAPPTKNTEDGAPETHKAATAATKETHNTPEQLEIVKLPSQFVVPVILDNRVRAMVVLSVAVEVETGQGDHVRALEPKLRDVYLGELFSLAALDGFRDALISRKTLELVKLALTERSKEVLGLQFVNVLVTDMSRQDVF